MPRTSKSIAHHDTIDAHDAIGDTTAPTTAVGSFDLEPADVRRPGALVGRRLVVSVPGAIAGAVLVCALAFGATLGTATPASSLHGADGSAADASGAGADAGAAVLGWDGYDGTLDDPEHPGGDSEPGSEGTDGPDASTIPSEAPEATTKPAAEPEPTDKPEPTKKPEPTDKPKPTETPSMGLTLAIKEGAVLIDWSTCEVDGADYYKVVRSSNATVKWPTGEGDELIAAIEVGGKTKAWDEHAPSGKRVWYRVFCVRHTDDGYKVLVATSAKSIETPEKPKPTPTPAPAELWIEAGVDGGAVVLHWEACDGDGFSHYRILRKADGEASVIAEVESQDTTTYVDDDVEPGVTYHYLVQAKGHAGDDWILLGTTGWVEVTVE
jgi:hypothetical protein